MTEQQSSEDSHERVLRLVSQLDSNNEEDRATAEQSLLDIGVEAIPSLLTLCQDERGIKEKAGRVNTLAFNLTCAFCGLLLLGSYGLISWLLAALFSADGNLFIGELLIIVWALGLLAVDYVTMSAISEKLSAWHNAVYVRNKENVIRRFLTHLLPLVKASDAHLFDEQRRMCLYTLLRQNASDYGRDPFPITILQAMEQVGDAKALPYVEYIATSVNNPGTREAAQACLPVLQQRADQEHMSKTLLRPITTSEASVDTLLRPAKGAGEADPQILLRPGAPDES